jgi:hypothetical protein
MKQINQPLTMMTLLTDERIPATGNFVGEFMLSLCSKRRSRKANELDPNEINA